MSFIVPGIVELFFIPHKFNHLASCSIFRRTNKVFPSKLDIFQKGMAKALPHFLDGENKNIRVSLVFNWKLDPKPTQQGATHPPKL